MIWNHIKSFDILLLDLNDAMLAHPVDKRQQRFFFYLINFERVINNFNQLIQVVDNFSFGVVEKF
jgi:hypothetical protein